MMKMIRVLIDTFSSWVCPSCGQVNYETRSTCERCGAGKG